MYIIHTQGLPQWLSSEESASSAGDVGSVPGSGTSPGGGVAAPCSVLAGKILGTEDPGGLWSMESQSQTQLKRLGAQHVHAQPLTLHGAQQTM